MQETKQSELQSVRIGAFWVRRDKAGKQFLSGSISKALDGLPQSITLNTGDTLILQKNSFKTLDNHPDYIASVIVSSLVPDLEISDMEADF